MDRKGTVKKGNAEKLRKGVVLCKKMVVVEENRKGRRGVGAKGGSKRK